MNASAPTRADLSQMTPSEIHARLMSREGAERAIATFELEISRCEAKLAHNTTHDGYGIPYPDLIARHRASIAWWQRHLAAMA